jgi:DsbC/DsbD-like thiol-disulfide interchange protein
MSYAERLAGLLRRGALPFALFLLAAPALAADAFSTDWARAGKSDARLVAGGGALAGFEIRLAPNAITYWREPGEAGVPPTFDFSGSDNIATVEPLFPAPKRIREPDGSEAFGYESDVVIPLKIEPRDPTKPVTLKLDASYAVCEKLCLPARAKLTLTLPSAASPYASAVEAAREAVPRALPQEAFGQLTGGAAAGWRLCSAREPGPPRDLFVEPPEGWWVSATSAPSDGAHDCFAITLHDRPKDAALPAALRLTMTGGAGAVETMVIVR